MPHLSGTKLLPRAWPWPGSGGNSWKLSLVRLTGILSHTRFELAATVPALSLVVRNVGSDVVLIRKPPGRRLGWRAVG